VNLWDMLPEWVRNLPAVHPTGGTEWVRNVCPRLQAEYRCPKRCRLAQVWVGQPGRFLLCRENGEKLPEIAVDRDNVWRSMKAIRQGRRTLIAAVVLAWDLDAVQAWSQAFRNTEEQHEAVCQHGRHRLSFVDILADLAAQGVVRRVLPPVDLAQR
jgi:hypothetical protein